MDFSDALIDKLAKKKLSQAELCRMTGIPSSLMSAYITGKKSPALSNAISIANAFNITLDELVGRNDDIGTKDPTNTMLDDELEILSLYQSLDFEDKAILRGEARGMLRNNKYNKKPEKLSC